MGTTIFKDEIDKNAISGNVSKNGEGDAGHIVPVAAGCSPHPAAVVVLSAVTILLTLRYIAWRLAVTQWNLWWLSLPLLAAEIFTALHVLGYQYTIWPRKGLQLTAAANSPLLPIFIFIPTVNEGEEILRPTIVGAIGARSAYLEKYPRADVRIVVCNDGFVANVKNWTAVEVLAASMGVECLTRKIHGGAKAGNIEHARMSVGAVGNCLLAVLDADQVAEPDFLITAAKLFDDPEVGWVQTRQFYRNTDQPVARWAESQASLFYDLVCPGKSAVNASYICGTNVMIRAEVLDQIGGFPTESVTEDFAASIRTHQTWRSVYISDTLAKGLGPLDLSGYFVQQSRWARGTMGVMRSDWSRVFLPAQGGLSFDQRVQYFLSGTHYLCGLRDLTFLATAVVSLYLSESPIKHVPLSTIAAFLIPYIAASQCLLLLQAGSTDMIGGMIIGYISFPTLVVSFFEAVINKKMRFRVTPKSQSNVGDLRAVLPHIFLIAICCVVIVHAFITKTAFEAQDVIPLLWVTYALCILTPSLFLARFRTD